jgi:hypothetical protein
MSPLTLPYEFVNYLNNPGLTCDAGTVMLSQYVCQNVKNGGNVNAANLLGNLRWMKEGGKGSMLNSLAGGAPIDLAVKGQGHPDTFVKIWDFMCRNQEQLKNIRLDQGKNVFDKYFRDNSDETALQMMVNDKFFGIDCVGFVGNYLVHTGLWDKYQGHEIANWDRLFKANIKKAEDVRKCQIILWSNFSHIGIVDWIHGIDGNQVTVDICQSSSGGPQCNERVTLTQTKTQGKNGYIQFKLEGDLPVTGHVYIMARDGFSYGD